MKREENKMTFILDDIQECIDCADREVGWSEYHGWYVHVQNPEIGCGMNEGQEGTFEVAR
tara:strand:+ start:885 stop:1064 length:180 start_codon:yes stop_codon:yes gene_type:complete